MSARRHCRTEFLEIAGQAGVQRIALHVNDPGLWKQLLDKPQKTEIMRHLVGNTQCRGRGDFFELADVACGVFIALLSIESAAASG